MGIDAYASYIAFAVVYLVLVFLKLYIIKGLIGFPVIEFYKNVFGRIVPVSILSFVLPAIVYFNMDNCLLRTFVVIAISGISTAAITYFIGMSKGERSKIIQIAKQKLNRNK